MLACGAIEWQSPSGLHDATLFELDRRIDDKVIKPIVIASIAKQLELDDGSGKRGTALTVVGHPEGGALSIGLAGSLEEISARLLDKGPRGTTGGPEYLHYSTPTEPGNSGSPVFETEHWQVVGLHHAGFNEKHGRPKLGGKAGSHEANEGIWLESIRKDLKDHLDQKRRGKRRGWFG